MTDARQGAEAKPSILVIDDTPEILLALMAALEAEFRLQFASSGATGLALAEEAPPDLILLDVIMPHMDGYEICRRLKANPRLNKIPFIFVTALTESDAESHGLALGAADYVTKPINVEAARYRIRNLLEREQLRKEVEAQRDQLKEAAEALRQARRREIEVGTSIQRTLLHGEVPEKIEGAWLAAYADASQVIDCVFYSVRQYRPGCFEVLVGDVMGKGVPAALMGAAITTAYSDAVADLLLAGGSALPTPAQIVNAIHQLLTPQLIALSSFATLALYRFDLDEGTLTWVNAGHTPGLLTRGHDSRPVAIFGDNLPIGGVPDEVYVQSCLTVGPGDSLLLFSDGITEARNAAGEDFGLERLYGLIEPGNIADLPPATVLHALRGEQRRFNGGGPGTDDLNVLMVKLHSRRRAPRGGIEDRLEPFVFTLPWNLEGLGDLRARIRECTAMLSEDDANALILASFEAATNAIRHSRLLVGDATLTCRINREDDAVVVELIYPSAVFTPPAKVQPDLSGQSENGFGLYIIEQSVDSVEYASPMPGIASIRLLKRASSVAA